MMDPIPISRDFNSARGFSIDSPAPGRYPGVTEQDYFAAKAVNASTLRLLPPLTVRDDELVEAVALIGDALAETSA